MSAYLATLGRLEPLVEQADHVVPGHGAVLDSERALAILREDRAYLSALVERGADAPLPLTRRNGAMRKIHAENVGASAGLSFAATQRGRCGDLVVGEAEGRDAVGVQLGVALLVALERGSRSVVAPAVELDGESVLPPLGVDLVAVELRVHDRAREAVAVAEVDEGGLEVAAGVGELLVHEFADPRRPRSTGADGQQ